MLFPNLSELEEKGQMGDWCFMDYGKPNEPAVENSYICFIYGVNSHTDIAILPIKNNPQPDGEVWNWDGNKEAPTITPSVRVLGGRDKPDIWHGFMTAGKLVLA